MTTCNNVNEWSQAKLFMLYSIIIFNLRCHDEQLTTQNSSSSMRSFRIRASLNIEAKELTLHARVIRKIEQNQASN